MIIFSSNESLLLNFYRFENNYHCISYLQKLIPSYEKEKLYMKVLQHTLLPNQHVIYNFSHISYFNA